MTTSVTTAMNLGFKLFMDICIPRLCSPYDELEDPIRHTNRVKKMNRKVEQLNIPNIGRGDVTC